VEELVLGGEGPLDPLVRALHRLRVVGQTLIVPDVFVQGVPIVSCVGSRHTKNTLLSNQQRKCIFNDNTGACESVVLMM